MSTLTYQYSAIDATGTKRAGSTTAASEQEAYRQLTAMGLTPMELRAAATGIAKGARIPARLVAQFTGQLSVLVSARLSISEGLHALSEQETNPALREVIRDISQRVASGETIADSLAQHPRVFSEVYVQTVRAAEKAGALPTALEHLASMLERDEETRRQIKGALTYPACVVFALSAGVTFLIAYVVPKFAKMFAERGVELPFFTLALQSFGNSIQNFWWAYLTGIVTLIFALRVTWRNPAGRQLLDALFHKLPFLRAILTGLAIQRFAQVLGVSLQSGLGLIESLELAGRAAGRPSLATDVSRLVAKVRTGGRLTESLPACVYLTPFTKRMLMAGETSGEIPRMCAVVARHYERETTHLTKNIATVIEPVLVMAIAVVVLIVALAIFLPMWNMVQLMG
jgi:type II secretory pathway component PulF